MGTQQLEVGADLVPLRDGSADLGFQIRAAMLCGLVPAYLVAKLRLQRVKFRSNSLDEADELLPTEVGVSFGILLPDPYSHAVHRARPAGVHLVAREGSLQDVSERRPEVIEVADEPREVHEPDWDILAEGELEDVPESFTECG